jgi:hypothetical protein
LEKYLHWNPVREGAIVEVADLIGKVDGETIA